MEEYTSIITEKLPLLALRGLSVFPNMLLNFDVERAKSTGALDAASNGDRRVFLIAQKEITKETPGQNDLFKIGTICYLKQVLKIPGGGMKVLVEGRCRARLLTMLEEKKYVWIVGSGRYYCETGDSDIGCINRIDNKLNGFGDFIEKQSESINSITKRKEDIETELQRENTYPDEINRLQLELTRIDNDLGVEIQ